MKSLILSREVAEMVRPEKKACYRNALLGLAAYDPERGLYVEGWMLTKHGIAIAHGWIEGVDGVIIDPTLPEDVGEYTPVFKWDNATAWKLVRENNNRLPLHDLIIMRRRNREAGQKWAAGCRAAYGMGA